MKCLIIAAGQGTRLKAKGEIKSLVPLLGVPIIERVIRSAVKGGADDFYGQREKVAHQRGQAGISKVDERYFLHVLPGQSDT